MYYDEVVNVVGGGRKSPIKRGGMNMFVPSRLTAADLLTELAVDIDGNVGVLSSPSKYYSPRKASWAYNIEDLAPPAGMKSSTLREKTEAVQREFDRLAEEMINRRSGSPTKLSGIIEAFDGDIYLQKERKHKSPTKRLI